MRRMRTLGCAFGAALLVSTLAGGVHAQAERSVGLDSQSGLTVTIYNRDLALVSESRRIEVAAGRNRLALLGVSRRLRPETVILSGDGLRLVEQSYEADLLSAPRLLERSLGERVWVRRVNPSDGSERYLEAVLVSIAGQPLVRLDDRLELVPPDELAFEPRGAGLRDQATLTAILESDAAGARELGIAYLSAGLAWQADYVARLNPAEDRLDLSGLVTLTNNSGTDYAAARLRLVAGDVNQVRPMPMPQPRAMGVQAEMAMAPAQDMVEAPIGEQHVYTLDGEIDLPQRVTKQVTLLGARGLPVVKEYRFEELVNAFGGAEEIGPVKAQVRLEIENREAAGLGRALPRGVVRVYQETGGTTPPIFIGEDGIDHTAKGEPLRLTTGRAFDVSGKALRTAFERISDKSYETAQRIELKNAKDGAVEVKVVGQMPPGWRMMEESQPHVAETANRLVWSLTVPAGGEARLDYRVRVTRP